jgi:hypothetical protein
VSTSGRQASGPDDRDSRRYSCLYRSALGFCWVGGGIISTAAGLWVAQWFPGPALLWVWIIVTAAVAVVPIMLSDRAAAAWARGILARTRGGR